ncbi:MAG TPA: RagB/SusD family nutrient uptake outer membrane protein [Gemmatimonadaceae bacterium]|nr:RagB/SusD family nutrient uptake outer membrane protein [Gemmatimonadaceae bacterium]
MTIQATIRDLRRKVSRASLAAAVGASLVLSSGCSDPLIPDYNNPTLPSVIPSAEQLQAQVTGLVAGDREQAAFFVLVLETMGRDVYRIDGADPRFIQQPLGQFSPGAFLVDFTWNSTYRTISAAQQLSQGVENSPVFTATEKAAAKGFAGTIEGLEYIKLIETRDSLGVPIATGGTAIEQIACKPAVLAHAIAVLDAANTSLAAGGTAFPFTLPAGFAGFNTPASFAKFNRGLAAKVHIYNAFVNYHAAGNPINTAELNLALAAIDASFYSPAPADFRKGVYHTYSTTAGDLTNGNFDRSVVRANPKVLSQAEAGDNRLSKIQQDPSFQKALPGNIASSDIIFLNITGPTTPLPIMIDEELVLMRAEVLWGLNRDAEALALVNIVRANAGLAPKAASAFPTRLDLLREILKQKRYSLLFESGDRLVDYRMFGLYSELGAELNPPVPGPQVIPFPSAEENARGGDLACH